jgi:hypothetical protein
MLRPTDHLKSGGSAVAWMLVVRGFTVALAGSTAIAFAQNSPNVPPGNSTPSQPGLLLPQPGNTNIGIPSQNIPGARELKKTGSDETKKKVTGQKVYDTKKSEGGVARGVPDTKKKTQPPAAEAARISPARIAPNVATDLADRTAVLARIERGLSPEMLAACRRAANNLAPRLGSLLSGPDWESRLLVAIVSELKEVGVSFDKAEELARQSKEKKSRPADERASRIEKLDKGGEAEALRGEAAEIKATAAAASAAIAVAGATVATIPPVGPIIAAALLVIAAVVAYLEQPLEKGDLSAADAKKKEGEGSAAEIAERLRRTKLRLVMQMESQKDDDLSAK